MSKIIAGRRVRRTSRSLLAGARISTGLPRLIDSAAEREILNRRGARIVFLHDAITAARVKLDLFFGREDTDRVPCPEGAIMQKRCENNCSRCRGTGEIAIADLRRRYLELIAWLEVVIA
jgi:hypothetical protein